MQSTVSQFHTLSCVWVTRKNLMDLWTDLFYERMDKIQSLSALEFDGFNVSVVFAGAVFITCVALDFH